MQRVSQTLPKFSRPSWHWQIGRSLKMSGQWQGSRGSKGDGTQMVTVVVFWRNWAFWCRKF